MGGKVWSDVENQLIINNYNNLETKELIELFPNRTWNAIKIQAVKLNMERIFNRAKIGMIEPLLEETHLAYYWTGFILADGHISSNKRLRVALALKDTLHLQKLAGLLKLEVKFNSNHCYISLMDTYKIDMYSNKFDIKHDKTYNPPNGLDKIRNDLLVSLIIGFIDGDGCIKKVYKRQDCNISIKNHGSWLPILTLFEQRLYKISKIKQWNETKRSKINAKGYSFLCISDSRLIKWLKRHIIKYNLPILERKWSIIDLNRPNKYDTAETNRKNFLKLKKKGYKNGEIAKVLGLSKSTITQISKFNFER